MTGRRVRGLGAHIKGTNGESQGVVPFLKVANDTAIAVNQGGKRKGAVCAYLETWHVDIEEFLDLRKNTGDDRRRTHDMNTANWVPDLFMQRVEAGRRLDAVLAGRDAGPARSLRPGLRRALMKPTKARRARGEMTVFKQRARHRSVAAHADHAVRDRPSLDHLQGPVQHALAAAACRRRALVQPLHRDHAEHLGNDEVAVCNLGSVNLACACHGRRARSTRSCSAHRGNRDAHARQRHRHQFLHHPGGAPLQPAPPPGRPRPDGLPGRAAGRCGIPICLGQPRSRFADDSMEAISYRAISASVDLAAERGRYPTLDGSLWSKGILPIDSVELLRR